MPGLEEEEEGKEIDANKKVKKRGKKYGNSKGKKLNMQIETQSKMRK